MFISCFGKKLSPKMKFYFAGCLSPPRPTLCQKFNQKYIFQINSSIKIHLIFCLVVRVPPDFSILMCVIWSSYKYQFYSGHSMYYTIKPLVSIIHTFFLHIICRAGPYYCLLLISLFTNTIIDFLNNLYVLNKYSVLEPICQGPES